MQPVQSATTTGKAWKGARGPNLTSLASIQNTPDTLQETRRPPPPPPPKKSSTRTLSSSKCLPFGYMYTSPRFLLCLILPEWMPFPRLPHDSGCPSCQTSGMHMHAKKVLSSQRFHSGPEGRLGNVPWSRDPRRQSSRGHGHP